MYLIDLSTSPPSNALPDFMRAWLSLLGLLGTLAEEEEALELGSDKDCHFKWGIGCNYQQDMVQNTCFILDCMFLVFGLSLSW